MTALAYESYSDRTATGPAQTAARGVAERNLVWKEAADLVIDADVVCASTYEAGPSATPIRACVRTTAYRNQAHVNPIPAIFAQLMGVSSFGVAATAIAETKDANATDCLKPLAIPDRWAERHPVVGSPWTPGPPAVTYDKWNPDDPANLLPQSV